MVNEHSAPTVDYLDRLLLAELAEDFDDDNMQMNPSLSQSWDSISKDLTSKHDQLQVAVSNLELRLRALENMSAPPYGTG